MKVNITSIRSQESALSRGSQATNTEGATKMTKDTGMERCTGQTAAAIRASGSTASNMA